MSTMEEKTISTSSLHVYPAKTSLANTNSETLSILSYNILYKDLVTKERYTHIENDEFRSWKYRLPRIRDTISAYDADIICLQEVDVEPNAFKSDFGDYFKSKLLYDHVLSPFIEFKKKKRAYDGHLGNAVLFNSNRFQLIHKEFLKKNPREMLCLFTDMMEIESCSHCCHSSVCCIYHSFFVINVHLSGHPSKWRNRLNAMQRILNKLKQFGHRYKNSKIERKTLKLNTNIHGNCGNMRIFLCGDFNAPKTGNVDKLLLHKMVDVQNYNITTNIYKHPSSEKLLNDKKIVRFAVDSKYSGAIIGEKGANIEYIREKTKAGIWISDASKGRCGLKNHRMLSIKGGMNDIIGAIELVMERMHEEESRSIIMSGNNNNAICLKIILFVERYNIEVLNIIEGVTKAFNVKLCVSRDALPFSSEKTVEIHARVNALKSAISLIMRRLFENERCINTATLYDAQVELDAYYKHPFYFSDCYHEGLLSILQQQQQNINNDDFDEYYDRIKYFPTYGDGQAFGSMDFIYYTKNNMKLIAITQSLDDKQLIETVCSEMDGIKEKKKSGTKDDVNKKEQSVLSNVLKLPNDKIISDHLPVAAIFSVPKICRRNGVNCACVEGKKRSGGRLRSKINKNKNKKYVKKDKNKVQLQNNNENTAKALNNKPQKSVCDELVSWQWHQMRSF